MEQIDVLKHVIYKLNKYKSRYELCTDLEKKNIYEQKVQFYMKKYVNIQEGGRNFSAEIRQLENILINIKKLLINICDDIDKEISILKIKIQDKDILYSSIYNNKLGDSNRLLQNIRQQENIPYDVDINRKKYGIPNIEEIKNSRELKDLEIDNNNNRDLITQLPIVKDFIHDILSKPITIIITTPTPIPTPIPTPTPTTTTTTKITIEDVLKNLKSIPKRAFRQATIDSTLQRLSDIDSNIQSIISKIIQKLENTLIAIIREKKKLITKRVNVNIFERIEEIIHKIITTNINNYNINYSGLSTKKYKMIINETKIDAYRLDTSNI